MKAFKQAVLLGVAGAAVWLAMVLGAGFANRSLVNLWDSDITLRLLRAEQLHAGRRFDDHMLRRVFPPDGISLHWTAPMDALLVSGAALFSGERGYRAALEEWSRWLPGLLAAAALFFIGLTLTELGRAPETGFWALGVFFLMPAMLGAFAPGNADHHGLQAVLWLALMLFVIQCILRPCSKRPFVLAGAAAGLGLWVSVQFLVPIVLVLCALGVRWLQADQRDRRNFALMPAALAAVLAAAITVEYPWPAFLTPAYDMVSVVHFTAFLLTAGAFAAASVVTAGRTCAAGSRAVVLAGFCVGAAAVTRALFPQVFVPPAKKYGSAAFDAMMPASAPLFALDPATAASFGFGLIFAALAVMRGVRAAPPQTRAAWLTVAVSVLPAWLVLTDFRWSPFFAALVVPLAFLCAELAAWFKARFPQSRGRPDCSFIGAAALALFVVAGIPLAAVVILSGGKQATLGAAHETVAGMISSGALTRALGQTPVTVAAPVYMVGELVYRTPHNALFGDYHRATAARLAYEAFFDAPTPAAACEAARAGHVGAVLFWSGSRLLPQSQRFADTIVSGGAPPWLAPAAGHEPGRGGVYFYRVTPPCSN